MELGSEFNLDPRDLTIKSGNVEEYFSNFQTRLFDYGRSAIKSVNVPVGKFILLPEFICESVIRCFSLENVHFYKITRDFQIDFRDLFSKIDNSVGTIYICHYFGYMQEYSKLLQLKNIAEKYKITVIEDTTQAIFSCKNIVGDVAVASLRKWFPVPQGGVLYSSNDISDMVVMPHTKSNDNSRIYGMLLKDIFLKKIYDTNSMYRKIFADCEDRVESNSTIQEISDLARFMLKCFNIDSIIAKRIRNYKRLGNFLSNRGIKYREFSDTDCPLVFPLRVKERDSFRRYLMNNKVYCAVHWPFDNIRSNERRMAKLNADELISLPIDQRYKDTDIDYLCDVIDKYGKDLQ